MLRLILAAKRRITACANRVRARRGIGALLVDLASGDENETELIVSLQSAGDRADKLSLFATYFGDPSLVNTQAARYRDVTPDRVNAFARTRLGAENRASLLYVPRGSEATAASRELAEAGAR